MSDTADDNIKYGPHRLESTAAPMTTQPPELPPARPPEDWAKWLDRQALLYEQQQCEIAAIGVDTLRELSQVLATAIRERDMFRSLAIANRDLAEQEHARAERAEAEVARLRDSAARAQGKERT